MPNESPGGLPPVPTTKLLAIGHMVAPLTPEQRRTFGPKEVPATVQLYLAGKIDQWWFRQDGKGVVFLMNVTSPKEAHELLEALPFAQAKLMRFDLPPVGPLAPLYVMLAKLKSQNASVS
jgi:hypothetical protein